MKIDINEILAEMLSAMKLTIKDDWSQVKQTANKFLQSKKDRLELLTSLRVSGEINNEFFLKRLEDEREILVSELHAIAIINKVLAQNAANAAIKVLQDAVLALIKL